MLPTRLAVTFQDTLETLHVCIFSPGKIGDVFLEVGMNIDSENPAGANEVRFGVGWRGWWRDLNSVAREGVVQAVLGVHTPTNPLASWS